MTESNEELEARIKELEAQLNPKLKKETPRYFFPGFQHHA